MKRNLKKDTAGMPVVKLALIGDTATQFLATAIRGMGVERGYNIAIYESEYNQVERQLLDLSSDLYTFDPDIIVIFQSTHKLCVLHSTLDQEKQSILANERIDFVTSVCNNPLLTNKKIIYFNYPEIDDTIFVNDFEATVFPLHPQIAAIKKRLLDAGAFYASMSGSGSTVFGLFKNDSEGRSDARLAALKEEFASMVLLDDTFGKWKS